MTSYVFVVDVEHGVETAGIFTATAQEMKCFGGEKSLFDFIARVVDTKREDAVQRITGIRKNHFGGQVEYYTLQFKDGNLDLVLTSNSPQADIEVDVTE